MKRIISFILVLTILISSIVIKPVEVEAMAGGEALLLTGAGYTVAYTMLPYALAGVAVAGSVYLTYKLFSNQKVKSIINSWYQSLSEIQKNIFNAKVDLVEGGSDVTIDKQFLADVNGLSLVNNIVTASIDDLNSSQLALLGEAYQNSIAYEKTIGELLEDKALEWDITEYNYKTLVLKNNTTLTWFFTNTPINPVGWDWSIKRIEINAVGETLTKYKDTSLYFPTTYLKDVIYMNLVNDMSNNSICLDVDYPELIMDNPVVMRDVLDIPVSLTLDYPIDWDNEEAIPLVPPVALDEPLTDTLPWGEAYPEAGTGTGTGDWGIVSGIKSLVESIKSILESLLGLITGIFAIPENITLDFDPLRNLVITDRFPFSIPWDIKLFFTTIGQYETSDTLYKWEFPLKVSGVFDDTVDIDLNSISNFQGLINAIKILNTLVFIIILILITKRILF